MMTPLALAILFHNWYEKLAPEFGYETREETREFDPNSKNGKLMVATCQQLMTMLKVLTQNEYNDLIQDSVVLDALEMADVEQWEGYAQAMRFLQGE